MKNDIATAIIATIAGAAISYFMVDMIISNVKTGDFSVRTVDSSENFDLQEPDPEVFNYKALNPTVEVYVGNGEPDGTSN